MIVVRLMGGLGNQMFQYAAARRLALRHDTELALDTEYFDRIPLGDTPRRFELGHLRIQARFASTVEIAELSGRCSNSWLKINLYLRRMFCPVRFQPRLINEQPGRFCSEVLTLPDNVYLSGYWQSECYFSDQAETIRRELMVNLPATDRNLTLAEQITQVESVAVHFRRGDYVSNAKTAAFHGVLPEAYYHQAIDEICQRIDNPHLFVFSDDPEWARRSLSFPLPTTIVDHNPPNLGYEDLRLMSLCRHAIIANSSFSWWGGWLIDNPAKIIVAPLRWFADGRHTQNLIPETWITLA